MYDRAKVDFSDNDHKNAEKHQNFIQGIMDALDDGFQPLQDLTVIGPAVWGEIDLVRVTIKSMTEALGRKPTAGEVIYEMQKYGYMLERNNGWLQNAISPDAV